VEAPALGQRIRYHRQRRGMTQMELAEHIGVSYQQVQKYEKGGSEITVRRLQRIADALQTSLLVFLPEPETSRLSAKAAGYVAEPRSNGRTKEEMVLLQLFSGIRSRKMRRELLRLMQSIVRLYASQGAPRLLPPRQKAAR